MQAMILVYGNNKMICHQTLMTDQTMDKWMRRI